MLVKFSLIFALFSFWGILFVWGQKPTGSISGLIFDKEEGRPMEYATVSLIFLRDSSVAGGALTKEDGLFSINRLAFGRYRIKIQFIGYRSYLKDDIILKPENPTLNLGRVDLISADTLKTETVLIEAEKSAVEIGPEKKVYNVEKMLTAEGGTAADVLEQIPSVTVDQDGKPSLRGAGNVTVFIDGRPSALTGALDQFPAHLIEKIEVISNPSARYDPDGMGGIINIILKKTNKPGYFGSINGSVGTRNKYNSGGNISYRNKKFSFQGAYGFRYTQIFRKSTDTRENFPADTFFITDQTGSGNNLSRSHTASGSVDFRPNDYNIVSANFDVNYRNNPREETILYRYFDENRVLTNEAKRLSSKTEGGVGYDGGLSYERKFKTPERKFLAVINYSNNNAEQSVISTQLGQISAWKGSQFRQLTPTQSSVGFLQIDYIHPLKNKGRWEAGIKTYLREIDNDFRADNYDYSSNEWIIDDKKSNRFVYNEQLYAIYGIYAGEWKKISYQAGLRLEQTNTRSEQLTQSALYKFNYFSFFPSIHLAYKLSDFNQITANMGRRIHRPNTRSLNPFYDYSDPLNITTGNPYLRPEYTYPFELGYNRFAEKWTLSTTLFYRLTVNQMTSFRFVQPDGAAILTQQNLGETHAYGAEAISINKWTKWWNTNFNVNVNAITFSDDVLVLSGAQRGVGANFKLISNFTPTKRIEIQLTYNLQTPAPSATGRNREVQALNAAIKWTILKGKGAIKLNLTDVFNTRRSASDVYGATFSQYAYWKRETQIGYLGFTYQFGNQKQSPQKKRDRESDGNLEGDI